MSIHNDCANKSTVYHIFIVSDTITTAAAAAATQYADSALMRVTDVQH